MSRFFYVRKDPVYFGRIDDIRYQSETFDAFRLEVVPVEERFIEAVQKHRMETGYSPAAVLLGWGTWYQLGWETKEREARQMGLEFSGSGLALQLTEYRGLLLYVRNDMEQGIHPLSAGDRVRPVE